jgi:hypothetical protein
MQIHLLGREPITGHLFNPEFVATDAFWENLDCSDFDQFKYATTVNSFPKKDIGDHRALLKNRRTESLLALEFILQNSNPYFDWDDAETESQNPCLAENPMYGDGRMEPLSYNITLRILERLGQEGLWFGAMPQSRASSVWRYYREAPKGPPLFKPFSEKLVRPENTKILLGNLVNKTPGNTRFQGTLYVYDQIGVEIHNPHENWTKNYYIADKPFVAVHISSEDLYDFHSEPTPIIIANQAFVTLILEHPKQAEKLYKERVCDMHHFRKQDEDSNYWDIDEFYGLYETDIALLFDLPRLQKEITQTVTTRVQDASRLLLKAILPELEKELEPWNRSTKVHLKSLRLEKGILSLQATVETPQEVYKVTFHGDKADVRKTLRTRTPASK